MIRLQDELTINFAALQGQALEALAAAQDVAESCVHRCLVEDQVFELRALYAQRDEVR